MFYVKIVKKMLKLKSKFRITDIRHYYWKYSLRIALGYHITLATANVMFEKEHETNFPKLKVIV